MLALAVKAVEVLAGAVQDKDAAIRTRAARLLLDYQLKLQKLQAAPGKRNHSETDVRQTTNRTPRSGVLTMPGVR